MPQRLAAAPVLLTALIAIAGIGAPADATSPRRLVAEVLGSARSASPLGVDWSAVDVVCGETTLDCHLEATQADNAAVAGLLQALEEGCAALDRTDCAVALTHLDTIDGDKYAVVAFHAAFSDEPDPEEPELGGISSEPVVRGVLGASQARLPEAIADRLRVQCVSDVCLIEGRLASNSAVAETIQALQDSCDAVHEAPCSVLLRGIEALPRGTGKLATLEVRSIE